MMIESLGGVQSLSAEQYKAPQQTSEIQQTATDGQNVDSVQKVDKVTKSLENIAPDEEGNKQDYSEQKEPSNEQIKQTIDGMRKKMNNSEVQFGIHEGTKRVTIKIIDKNTKEVIKELPPEKTLDMIAKAWELAGILVDEKR